MSHAVIIKFILGTAIFCVITQRVLVISYRSFGTTHRSHFQGVKSSTPWSSHRLRGGSLNSCINSFCLVKTAHFPSQLLYSFNNLPYLQLNYTTRQTFLPPVINLVFLSPFLQVSWGKWTELKTKQNLQSSRLHRASMTIKHFIIQLMHKYIIRSYN